MSEMFAALREPESVPALDPAEVRRRGDRLRRRRAGLAVAGAVCAAAVVVTGTSVFSGDPRSESQTGVVDSPDGEGAFPAAFDLADGLSRDSTITDAEAPTLDVCGKRFALGDRAVASQRADDWHGADFTVRGFSIYPDDATARAVSTDLITAFGRCPRFTADSGREWTTQVQPSDLGDQGWVVTRFGDAPDPRWGRPEVILLVRVDTMLLVVHQREIHGVDPESLSSWASQQVEWLLHRQWCLLADEGCAWRSDPDVLRPDGWEQLRLGMSRKELEAIGDVGFSSAGDCTAVDLGPGAGTLSGSNGLVSITVPQRVTTPNGIGHGSSRADVHEQYHVTDNDADVVAVRASPTTDYEFTFVDGQVTQLTLLSVDDGGCL